MSDDSAQHWFPMRVTYNRELKVKEQLELLNMEYFLPLRYEVTDNAEGYKRSLVPAIHNLIFVHSTRDILTELKMTRKELEPLRYMMHHNDSGDNVIMTVPDNQMDNFMRVASVRDDSVIFLDNSDYITKIGRKVRITGGYFKDVVGVIKRIKNNKHVVVQIEGLAAVAITYVPAFMLQEVS